MQDNRKDSDVERRLDAWAASQSSAGLAPELQQKLRNALRPSLAPVKPLPSRTNLFLIFLGVLLSGGAGIAAMLEKTGLHLMTGVQLGGIAAILVGCGMLLIATLAGQMVPGARQMLPLWATFALCGMSALLGIAMLFPWRAPADFVAEGWPCAVMEIAVAIPAAIGFWLLGRRGVLFASPGTGATLAGAGVALALIPLQSQCMFQQAPHLLVWHVGTALLLVGLGAAAGNLSRP